MKTGILVVNLGTPDTPQVKDVKKYLTEFLTDERVIDLSSIKRNILVRGIIVPFRAPKIAKEYKKLWLKNGSPLMVYGRSLVEKLNTLFDNDVEVELAMRYQNPSIEKALTSLRKKNVERIIVFPLFPQYASATTGSVVQKVMSIISKWNIIPSIDFINSYHTDSRYINLFTEKVATDIDYYKPDHVLFSYHGIPERHLKNIQKQDNEKCAWPNCSCGKKSENKPYCYRSACFKTSELIAQKIDTPFSTSFQSRLGKDPWIQPYTDDTIIHLIEEGVKNLLVVSPSFVADCLETTLEIGEEYRELFLSNGGKKFHFTRSLNDDDDWAKAIYDIINEKLQQHEKHTFNSTSQLYSIYSISTAI
ncbi:ferrochelatase [Fulvivirga maritima]|uniref:ferrochelatase n=1 Tax=Fulvivirga maritima TaxID=2904247 RepID=UPI001F28C18D|nr:ferrochelatase [Fulvivirga maritima]UII26495.1 ferrochelatase [Fulvivirga maritima]